MGEEEKAEEVKGVEEKELVVPMAVTPVEHIKLLERINAMDQTVEFVAGELWQRQGEKIGLTLGLLYGALLGLFTYVMFLIA
ncbi:MAG: tetrahydromethanopterin S-methyltransferase subunit G [Methanophagales archaeon]|nr:tetrahydromethanopterin S-methyltransferase subunit G [Methanophagales archaeon]